MRAIVLLVTLAFVMAGCMAAQTGHGPTGDVEWGPPEDEAKETTPTTTVRGRVLDSEGLPLAGAKVTIRPPGATVSTPGDGSFEARNVPIGLVDISARKNGFESKTLRKAVEAGQDLEVDLVLAQVASTEPVHLSQVHKSYMAFYRAGVSQYVPDSVVESCQSCSWTTYWKQPADYVLIETDGNVFLRHPVDPPLVYLWLAPNSTSLYADTFAVGNYEMPTRLLLEPGQIRGHLQMYASLHCGPWVCHQEERTTWITTFANQEPAADFTAFSTEEAAKA